MKSREKSLTLLLLLGALCVFTWLDLSLSMTLYHPNWLARVLEVLGGSALSHFNDVCRHDLDRSWEKMAEGWGRNFIGFINPDGPDVVGQLSVS